MIDSRQHVVGKLIPYDFETVTIADTAIGLTASKINSTPRPKKIYITFETASCRFRYDGTNPTSTVGHLFVPTSSLILEGFSQMQNVKFIRTGGTSAVAQVSYLR